MSFTPLRSELWRQSQRKEIPIIVKEASDATYANVDYAIETFRIMGYVPFTRAVLDDADILSSASQEVQQEHGKILQLRVERQGLSANNKDHPCCS